MIRIKDHKQLDMFDPWDFLSPKRRRMLDESWPGLFREQLLCELPLQKILPFLREDLGRPCKELYTLLGVLPFQQTMDLNDIEAVEQLSFNIQWHYALNITEESDGAKYISEKTLWSWRQIDEKEQTLNLITHVAVETGCEHDSKALMPDIEDSQKRHLAPKTLIVDTFYGSDDNQQAAKAQHVELVAPTFKSTQSDGMDFGNFSFDDTGRTIRCPAGHSPVKVSYKKKTQRFSARFDSNHCQRCPLVSQCPVQPGKKEHFLRYSNKDHQLAVRRAAERSEEFIDTYRWRAGVEATMSQYDRLTGIKHLRVRGFEAVRYYATLKAAWKNLLRGAMVRSAQIKPEGIGWAAHRLYKCLFPFVKEQICIFFFQMGRFCLAQIGWADSYEKVAA